MIDTRDMAKDFIKPIEGIYRMVSIPDGKERTVEVFPANRSVRLVLRSESVSKAKRVWNYLFDGKRDCRLLYEGTETYSFRFWDEESFTVDTECGPIFFEKLG